jgi:hypothetical protein
MTEVCHVLQITTRNPDVSSNLSQEFVNGKELSVTGLSSIRRDDDHDSSQR